MNNSTDQELMVQLAAGHDLALNELMNRWGEKLASFVHRLIGNRTVATDLAQETFVKLYQNRNKYRAEGKLSTYLFAIATNLARNHTRWQTRHATVSYDAPRPGENEGSAIEIIDPKSSPDESVLRSEKAEAIQAAFLQLPSELRECMTLFLYEDMSYAEIATVVECSIKAVETRIYRARKMLKAELERWLA